jgi:acyl transferase domain-containing protein
LGFGGSNAHITLEEANPQDSASSEDLALLGSRQTTELVLLAAENLEELAQQVKKLIPVAERICRAELTDLAAALAKAAPQGSLRLAIVAESPWHLTGSLKRLSLKLSDGCNIEDLDDPPAGSFAGKAQAAPTWIALFPGQGSQRLNMAEHLLRRYPFVRELYDEAAEFVKSDCIFREVSAADDSTRKSWEAELRNTRVAQHAIVLTSLAALRVIKFLGLRPAASIGHS